MSTFFLPSAHLNLHNFLSPQPKKGRREMLVQKNQIDEETMAA